MFRFHIWGDRACFARPEFRRDRISYDVLPPLAARGIIEAIYWSPAIRWQIDRIHVLRPIAFDWVDGAQVRQLDLVDVAYVIETHFELSDCARESDHVAQHASLVRRRADRQQPYRQPFFGIDAYPAHFRLLKGKSDLPESTLRDRFADFGWMIHDLDAGRPPQLRFFRPTLSNGVIEVGDVGIADLPT